MSPITLLFTVLVLKAVVQATPHSPDKSHKPDKHLKCQEFTQGTTFDESLAIGSWHLLHFKTEESTGVGISHCIEFSHVADEERKDLNERVGQYVENLKWENLTLKMEIPCSDAKANKTRNYYLEKLEENGSYRTLQMPPPSAKLDLADFHRYGMRLKMIEGHYLGMMDCHEKFVFILGKTPSDGKDDPKFKKMIDLYWPDEN